jgi:hypothetical protein
VRGNPKRMRTSAPDRLREPPADAACCAVEPELPGGIPTGSDSAARSQGHASPIRVSWRSDAPMRKPCSASADAHARLQRPAPRGAVSPASACKLWCGPGDCGNSAVPRRLGCGTELGAAVTRDRRHLEMEHGAPVSKRNLEGEQSPGRIGFVAASNGCGSPRTRRWSKASKPTLATTTRHPAMGRREPSGARERQGGNGCGDAERLPAGNILRGVRTALRGHSFPPDLLRRPLNETQRTSRSAAGCNKPANREAEETGEVVQNHEVGTRERAWQLGRRSGTSHRLAGVDASRPCRWRGERRGVGTIDPTTRTNPKRVGR